MTYSGTTVSEQTPVFTVNPASANHFWTYNKSQEQVAAVSTLAGTTKIPIDIDVAIRDTYGNVVPMATCVTLAPEYFDSTWKAYNAVDINSSGSGPAINMIYPDSGNTCIDLTNGIGTATFSTNLEGKYRFKFDSKTPDVSVPGSDIYWYSDVKRDRKILKEYKIVWPSASESVGTSFQAKVEGYDDFGRIIDDGSIDGTNISGFTWTYDSGILDAPPTSFDFVIGIGRATLNTHTAGTIAIGSVTVKDDQTPQRDGTNAAALSILTASGKSLSEEEGAGEKEGDSSTNNSNPDAESNSVVAEANARFGFDVVISDKYVVASAPYKDGVSKDNGVVYVYAIEANDQLKLEGVLKVSNPKARDFFGHALHISGDTLIISAPYADDNNIDQGIVYLFNKVDGKWEESTILTHDDNKDSDMLGKSVAINGNYALAGAPYANGTFSNSGAAFIYTRSDEGVWSSGFKLAPTDLKNNELFGQTVALSNNLALVGAPLQDRDKVDQGAAYIYKLVEGSWVYNNKLVADEAGESDLFGSSLAINGESVFVGSPYGEKSITDQGLVYVFTEQSGSWTLSQTLVAPDATVNDYFGKSLWTDGIYLVVGAPYKDSGSDNDSGVIYIYEKENGLWNFKQKVTPETAKANDYFGHQVSIFGGKIVVGTPYNDDVLFNGGAISTYQYLESSWQKTGRVIPTIPTE